MAVDDFVSDSYVLVGASAEVDIQPASGDEWLVQRIATRDTDGKLKGTDGSNDTDALAWPPAGADTAPTVQLEDMSGRDFNIMSTNAQWIILQNTNGGSGQEFKYDALKMKD